MIYCFFLFCIGMLTITILKQNEERRQLMAYYNEKTMSAILASSSVSSAVSDGYGWKNIHVFYGKTDHLSVHTGKMAQAKQDTIVSSLLHNKKNGYFIDLASNDATYLSNTYMLEQNWNWTGRTYFVCAEFRIRFIQCCCCFCFDFSFVVVMNDVEYSRKHEDKLVTFYIFG